MFPTPIAKKSKGWQIAYKVFLPIALFIWLLPLIAIFMTSIRPGGDINAGNVFGWPSEFQMVTNYLDVFRESQAATYLWNSVKITVPTMILSVSLAALAGYALAIYRFRFSLALFFVFVAGNFVPFQILMVPVRDLSLSLGLYNTVTGLVLFHAAFQAGFCTLFMRNFIKALPFELIESARIEGVGEFQIFWHLVLPLVRPALGGARGADLHLRVERFLLGDRAYQRRKRQADHRRGAGLERAVRVALAPRVCRLPAGRHAAGRHVLPDAEAFHCRPDAGCDERLSGGVSPVPVCP